MRDAASAAAAGDVALNWIEATEAAGHFRIETHIQLGEAVFDWLFNGPSGYRAQYYLSPEEGVLYNRQITLGLEPAIRTAYDARPLETRFDFIATSLLSPHAKIWIHQERDAFDDALPDTLNPHRWVSLGATRGRRAPLPSHCSVDLKGAFVRPVTGELFVDELKLSRPCDLHFKGYT